MNSQNSTIGMQRTLAELSLETPKALGNKPKSCSYKRLVIFLSYQADAMTDRAQKLIEEAEMTFAMADLIIAEIERLDPDADAA